MDAGERALLRDGVTIGLAVGAIAVSFGLLARAAGVSALMTCGMSLVMFGGGAQFLLLGVVQTGGGMTAGVLAALLLNARHTPFGLSLVPLLRGPLWQRMLSSHLIVDESTAFALAQPEPRRARRAFYIVGVTLWLFWQLGTIAGAFGGQLIHDPAALGLDAAFPAGLLAMLVPQLRSRGARVAALGGGALALAATPLLPAGGPILLAGLAGGIGYLADRRAS